MCDSNVQLHMLQQRVDSDLGCLNFSLCNNCVLD